MEKNRNDEVMEAMPEDARDESLVVVFKKPYKYEGREYTEVDLSGMEDLNALALENVGRIVMKKHPGLNPATVEMTMEYARLIAARVTNKPLEFFLGLPAQEAIKLKSAVVGFLYGGDGDN